jgi:hypothetical protein
VGLIEGKLINLLEGNAFTKELRSLRQIATLKEPLEGFIKLVGNSPTLRYLRALLERCFLVFIVEEVTEAIEVAFEGIASFLTTRLGSFLLVDRTEPGDTILAVTRVNRKTRKYLFLDSCFSVTVIGAIVVNLTSTVRGMVLSTGAFFSSFSFFSVPVDSGAAEDDDPVADAEAVSDSSAVSLGGVFSAEPVDVSSADELPAKKPLSFPSQNVSRQ